MAPMDPGSKNPASVLETGFGTLHKAPPRVKKEKASIGKTPTWLTLYRIQSECMYHRIPRISRLNLGLYDKQPSPRLEESRQNDESGTGVNNGKSEFFQNPAEKILYCL